MIRGAVAVVFMVVVFCLVMHGVALPQQNPNCEGWISHSCCCTNDCCFVVEPGTVEAVDQDHYRILATGQILKRTGWSKNGMFMRCACDQIEGKWTVHSGAMTRCIFPPMPST
jgi:hypothetical protein